MCFSEENDFQLNKNFNALNFRRKKKFSNIYYCQKNFGQFWILDKNYQKI